MKTTKGVVLTLLVSIGVASSQTQYAFTNLVTGVSRPYGTTVDAFGQVYLATGGATNLPQIARISPDGLMATFAPTFELPVAVVVDESTNIFVGDIWRHAILKISSDGSLSTFAGSANGQEGAIDGTGTTARFGSPEGMARDPGGNLWVLDSLRRICRVTPDGVVTTIPNRQGVAFDGYTPNAGIGLGRGITVDARTNLFVVDRYCVRKLEPVGTNWFISTIAGRFWETGSTDGIGAAARFNRPHGITVDGNGNLYVADELNHVIRKLTPIGSNWMVRTIGGKAGEIGNSTGLGASVRFSHPFSLAADNSGNLYISDNGNARVVRAFATDVPEEMAFLPGLGRPRVWNGNLEALLAGPANIKVVIEVTTDFDGWSPVQTNTIPETGLLELAIVQSAEAPRGFYRARSSD